MVEAENSSLRDYLEIIIKRKVLIILLTILAVTVTGIVSFIIPPTYEAKTSVVIGKTNSNQNQQTQYSDILMYQNLVKTYAQIAKSKNVAKATAGQIKDQSSYTSITSDDIASALTVTPQQDTQIIDISIKSKSAEQAKTIADVVTDSFISEAKRIYPTQDIQIMDSAQMPKVPIQPNKKLNIAIAFLLGLMVSVCLALLLEYADNSIKSENDVEKCLDLPVIGIIPMQK